MTSIDSDLLTLNQDNMVGDIVDCATEPIHIPGLIMPHGLMLVLSESDLTICQSSKNALSLIGIPAQELLQQSIEQVVGGEQFGQLKAMIRSDQVNHVHPLKLRLPDSPDGNQFDVLIHRVNDQIVFEAEPVQDEDISNFNTFYEVVREATARLQSTGNQVQLCQAVADEVRKIIEYDRVMVYRFDDEWNGVVVAESQVDGLPVSYLGLHFPASDIPAQARRLFKTNRVRGIPDADYTPVGFARVSSERDVEPFDMSHCVLRSASPVHLEYLRNMGVVATLSVSLLKDGELWGLIACHHYQPKLICAEHRLTCSFLSEIFESQLAMREEGAEKAFRVQTSAIQVRFLDLFSRASSLSGLTKDPTSVLNFVDAEGAAIVQGMKCTLIGRTPNESEIPGLIESVLDHFSQDIYATDSLAAIYPAAERFKDVACGMLGIEISRDRGDYLLWFRPEFLQTVDWAGNPDKPVSFENGTGRFHPRKSFELWKKVVTLHSKQWKHYEIAAVTELAHTFCNAILSEVEIRARNQQLQSMSREAGMAEVATGVLHNVGNVLNSINTAATQAAKIMRNSRLSSLPKANELIQSHATDFASFVATDPRGQQLPNYIQQIAKVWQDEKAAVLQELEELQKHIEHVKDVIRLQQTVAKKSNIEQELNLLSLVEDSIATIGSALSRNEVKLVRNLEPIPPLHSDSHKIVQILVNLVSNAMQAVLETNLPMRQIEVRTKVLSRDRVVVQIIDNGIGIADENLQRIFQHGFTTKKEGHGFGLHSCALLANELGGSLTVESKGINCGSTFALTLPLGK